MPEQLLITRLLDALAEVTERLEKQELADWLREHPTFHGFEPSPVVHRAKRAFLNAYGERHQG